MYYDVNLYSCINDVYILNVSTRSVCVYWRIAMQINSKANDVSQWLKLNSYNLDTMFNKRCHKKIASIITFIRIVYKMFSLWTQNCAKEGSIKGSCCYSRWPQFPCLEALPVCDIVKVLLLALIHNMIFVFVIRQHWWRPICAFLTITFTLQKPFIGTAWFVLLLVILKEQYLHDYVKTSFII